MSYSYVSLFSGAGGLDIGLERAGFEAVSLNEIEVNFCESLIANRGWQHCDNLSYFSEAEIINADIRELAAKDLFPLGGRPDVVVGGPPCQAFSSAGKQLSVLDARGALVQQFIRVVDELKPKMFLFENVRGLVTARGKDGVPGSVLLDIISQLEGCGYSVRACLLNSADYGSFQRRVRCFLIGSSKGIAPEIPPPSNSKKPDLFDSGWRSLKEFLQLNADTDSAEYVFPTDKLLRELRDLPNGSGLKSKGRVEPTRPGGHWGYRQGTFIADLELPARTVTGSSSQDWVRWDGQLRRLTFSEVSLLQGFPIDWKFCGTKAQRFKQVGNAVPSVFGEVLGRMMSRHLDQFPKSKPQQLDFPKVFKGYIDYAIRDGERNKDARLVHKNFQAHHSE